MFINLIGRITSMKVTFNNSVMKRVGTIARVPEGSEISFDSTYMEDIGKVVDSSPNYLKIIEKLCESKEIPKDVLISVISDMKKYENDTEEKRVNIINKSALKGFISGAANLSTIAAFIYEVSQKI